MMGEDGAALTSSMLIGAFRYSVVNLTQGKCMCLKNKKCVTPQFGNSEKECVKEEE